MRMGRGYIYILVNPEFGDLLKIGKTTREPQERAVELSRSSGVPTDFMVAHYLHVSDCDEVESLVHEKLKQYRLNPDREFFRLSLRDAVQTLSEVASNYQLPHLGASRDWDRKDEDENHHDIVCQKCGLGYRVLIWISESQSTCPTCKHVNNHG